MAKQSQIGQDLPEVCDGSPASSSTLEIWQQREAKYDKLTPFTSPSGSGEYFLSVDY